MRRKPLPSLIVTVGALVVFLVRPTFAYLDPGTGSYILQLLIGGLLGGLFAVGVFWKRVLAFIKRIFRPRK